MSKEYEEDWCDPVDLGEVSVGEEDDGRSSWLLKLESSSCKHGSCGHCSSGTTMDGNVNNCGHQVASFRTKSRGEGCSKISIVVVLWEEE